MYVFYFLIALILSIESKANTNQTVIWLTDDYSEIDKLQRDDYLDTTTDLLKLLLPKLHEFQLKYTEALLPRALKLIQREDNICAYNWIKTPKRQEHAIFSQPFSFYPSLRLFYLTKFTQLPSSALNQKGELSQLSRLFIRNNKLLGLVKGRSYGAFLDSQIAKLKPSALYIRSGLDPYESTHSMLLRNRLHYIIEYPNEIKRHSKLADSLSSISIAGNEPYVIGRIACSRSPLGKKIINKINSVLSELYSSPEYLIAHTRYLPSSEHASFKQYLSEFEKAPDNASE